MAKEEGRQEGLREGILATIELALELKFKQEGLQLLPDIQQIEHLDDLKKVLESIKQVSTFQELRSIHQSNT